MSENKVIYRENRIRKGLHGSLPRYEEAKGRHQIMVTDYAWQQLMAKAEFLDISVSELIERVGRGMVDV